MSERNKRLPSTFGLNGFDSDSELDFYSEASKPEKKSDQTNVSFFLGDARVFPFAPERDLRTVNDLVDSFSNVPEGKLTCPADHLIDVWITSISEVVASKSLPSGRVFDLSVAPIVLEKQQDWVFLPIVNTHYRLTVNSDSCLIVNTYSCLIVNTFA